MTLLLKKILVYILTLESRLILAKYKPFIIAVTGSVGKTSTKDAIYSVIKRQSKHARKSEKSLNSEIGLPLTIIGAPNAWHSLSGWLKNIMTGFELILWRAEYPDCLVLELGADHPGDIRRVASWLKPDVAVITRVSQTPVHVEFFPTPDDVFKEKSALAYAVKKGGTVVLFADEEKMLTLVTPLREAGINVKTFGLNQSADVRGSEYAPMYAEQELASPTLPGPIVRTLVGMSFVMNVESTAVPVTVSGALGATYMYPLLAAATVGRARAMPVGEITEGCMEYHVPPGRMNVVPGVNGSIIVDDSYNSSPDAVDAALEALRGLECAGRKIVAFGDMMELGKYASDEHKKMGKAAAVSAQLFVTVGPRTKTSAAPEAVVAGMKAEDVLSFDSSQQAADYLLPLVRQGDVILVKGSQSMRMERICSTLLRYPEKAATLLVRQEKEWLEKK